MRYNIYYILEKWAPNLTKNPIYQKLIKELIPTDTTYEIAEPQDDIRYMELEPKEYGKTIVVDNISTTPEETQHDKIEYSCYYEDDDTQFTSNIAISETDNGDLIYSCIEGYNQEEYQYQQAMTIRISYRDEKYILSDISIEKCLYDADTLNQLDDLKKELEDNLISRNNHQDYVKALKEIIKETKEKHYVIPELELSITAYEQTPEFPYQIIVGDGIETTYPKTKFKSSPLDKISLEDISTEVNDLYNCMSDIIEPWQEKLKNMISLPKNSQGEEIDITRESFSIAEYISKTSNQESAAKTKVRKGE